MVIATLSLLAATSFAGGTPDRFVRAVHDATNKNSLLEAAARATVKPFEFDFTQLDAFADLISRNSPFRMAPGVAPNFTDDSYVERTFDAIVPRPEPAPEAARTIDAAVLTDGKVTLKTDGGKPVLVGGLPKLAWGKPLAVDYLFRELCVSADVKAMPEHDFLAAVASTVGAIFEADDKGYHLAYDYNKLRARVQHTLERVPTPDTPSKIDFQRKFFSDAVQALDDDTLGKLFADAGQNVTIDVPANGDLAGACVAYIQGLETLQNPAADRQAARGRRPRRAPQSQAASDTLSRIDPRAPVRLRLGTNGTIVLSLPLFQRGGRVSRYQQF